MSSLWTIGMASLAGSGHGSSAALGLALENRSRLVRAGLVDIGVIDQSIQVEIPYATSENFIGQVVYPVNKCYLIREVAEALSKVQKELLSKGYRLKVLDGYRPFSVQETFFQLVSDENYVARPRRGYFGEPVEGSRHNRGAAVDVTLVDLDDREVEMPSKFDDFSERAHRTYQSAASAARFNAMVLQTCMEKEGFVGLPTEWWHFDFNGWEKYPLLDIPLD